MNTENNIFEDDTKPTLIRAGGDDANYSNKTFRLFLSLGYLGIFGSFICMFMMIMSAVSRENHLLDVKPMAAAIIALVVCIVAVIVVSLLDKKSRNEFKTAEKKLLANAKSVDGRIVGVVKHIRHVSYAREVFDEITWNFKIEYFDEENNKTCTVESDRYLNDISAVLADDSVKVYIKSDGTLAFDGYKLRESFDDEYISPEIEEDVQDMEV